jgi:hypothetical protein
VLNLEFKPQSHQNKTTKITKSTKIGWWLMPIILATQEAEIRRIEVQWQSRQIAQEILSRKKSPEKGLSEWLKV